MPATKEGQAGRRRTAIHEAGHIVLLLEQRTGFRRVTIRPGEDYLGAVFYRLSGSLTEALETGDFLATARAAESVVRVSLAGECAVRLHCGPRHAGEGCQSDHNRIADALLAAYGLDCPELQAHLRFLRLQTTAILARPIQRWQTLTIADALVTRETLSRKDVSEALRRASGIGGAGRPIE